VTKQAHAPAAARGKGIQFLRVPEELDYTTADRLAARGGAAIACHARVLLLDLAGLSFCDASGLSALVRIANQADAAGCRYGLIAPRPPVATLLHITRLDQRLPVFATIGDALAQFAGTGSTAPNGGGLMITIRKITRSRTAAAPGWLAALCAVWKGGRSHRRAEGRPAGSGL
jgi:anti-anti-sigma factor